MDVALGRQGVEQVDLGHRQTGVAEERQPHRQVERLGVLAQPRHRRRMALERRRRVDALDQASPELRLPGEVGRRGHGRRRRCRGPRDQSATSVGRCPAYAANRPRQPARHREAAAEPEVGLVAGVPVAEVTGQGGRPRLVEAGVDHVEQRPGQGVGGPRVVVAGTRDLGDQRAGRPERDGRAHAVAVGTRAEHVGEPLREPPLHPPSGYDDQLAREGIGSGVARSLPSPSASASARRARCRWRLTGGAYARQADTGPRPRRPPPPEVRGRGPTTVVACG